MKLQRTQLFRAPANPATDVPLPSLLPDRNFIKAPKSSYRQRQSNNALFSHNAVYFLILSRYKGAFPSNIINFATLLE